MEKSTKSFEQCAGDNQSPSKRKEEDEKMLTPKERGKLKGRKRKGSKSGKRYALDYRNPEIEYGGKRGQRRRRGPVAAKTERGK